MKKFTPKWRWHFNHLKRCEGGPDITGWTKLFRNVSGVKAYNQESCYVGHVCTIVDADTKKNMLKALRVLKKYSMIDSIKDERAEKIGYGWL